MIIKGRQNKIEQKKSGVLGVIFVCGSSFFRSLFCALNVGAVLCVFDLFCGVTTYTENVTDGGDFGGY